jgi:hypothetical protein
MYDVNLFGHLTFDRIFDGTTRTDGVGSMGNVWDALLTIEPTFKINLEPTDIGEAIILVDQEKAERTSVAKLNLKSKKPDIYPARWNHILYLNAMSDPSFIKNIDDGIMSADLCGGPNELPISMYQYLDFLFVAEEDLPHSLDLLKQYVNIAIIVHYKGGSTTHICRGDSFTTNVEVIKDINVLGCGDKLAAYFIKYYLDTHNIKSSIELAHKFLTEQLNHGRTV